MTVLLVVCASNDPLEAIFVTFGLKLDVKFDSKSSVFGGFEKSTSAALTGIILLIDAAQLVQSVPAKLDPAVSVLVFQVF